MKHRNYYFSLLVLFLGVAFWPGTPARAQQSNDTLLVKWLNSKNKLAKDTLRTVIAGDTAADGSRLHKVYKLQAGGYYWLTGTINNVGFPLTIVGEKPDPNDPTKQPAIIQMVHPDQGTRQDWYIFGGQSSLTLKNVWILGNDDDGVQTYYAPLTFQSNRNRYVFDHVIFSRSNFAIPQFKGANNEIYFTHCKFLNLIGKPSTQQWEGLGVRIVASQDTIVFENNTFFNIEYTSFQLENGYANYIRFNHNTIVNQGRQFEDRNKKQEYFTNNLIINGFWQGEGHGDLTAAGRDPDQYATGIFTVGLLPSADGLEQERRIVLANDAMWLDPQFTKDYGDSIHAQPLVADTSAYFFDTNPHIVAKDTMWLDSAPTGMSEDAFTGKQVDLMWNNINDLRTGVIPATPYFYKIPVDPNSGDTLFTGVPWPLPIDFAYDQSNAIYTKGTDGLPIGDLTWFPDKLTQFKANKAQYIEEIENMAGGQVSFNITSTVQAESGQLSGDAKVDTFNVGTTFFNMKSGGSIKWTFNLDKAGTYGLKIKTRAGDAKRGEYIYINGNTTSITKGDDGGYLFKGLTTPDWQWYTITKDTLTADTQNQLDFIKGTNTIEIAPEWGYQDFSEIDLFAGGDPDNVIKQLTAQAATITGPITPGDEDADHNTISTPQGFMSVELGANGNSGSISFDTDSLADGFYLARIFYRTPDGAQTGKISINGTDAGMLNFTADTSFTSTTTQLFQIKNGQVTTQAGNQASLKLTTNGHVIIDYLQLAQKTTAVEPGNNNQLPGAYSLSQNYPNPFNPTTNIRFKLPEASNVQLTVYNLLGQKVATLINNRMSAGVHVVQFDASHLASGLYFYRLKAGSFVMNKKMMLIK